MLRAAVSSLWVAGQTLRFSSLEDVDSIITDLCGSACRPREAALEKRDTKTTGRRGFQCGSFSIVAGLHFGFHEAALRRCARCILLAACAPACARASAAPVASDCV
mmetsp:Transcript_76649/g.230048  ORF Transcript_76649/g.230048 Transcript_76649/m.230048 type:complete len:106 (-) Transcript_76649:111-428(-)